MKLLIQEISPSRKEIRIKFIPTKVNGMSYYGFGDPESNFPEGSILTEYIPFELLDYYSLGPNPGVLRLIVAYLKDVLASPSGYKNTLLLTQNNNMIPIVNIVVDDINLLTLTNETIPSLIVKLLDSLFP